MKRAPAHTSARSSIEAAESGQRALLGTVGVAEMLGVHPKHVYRLLRRGLPGHRLGGEWRYDREEVLAWLRQTSSPAAPTQRRALLEPDEAVSAAEEPAAAPPLLAANGDVCVELLLRTVADATGQTIGFVQADRTSGRTLVGNGNVVATGVHGTYGVHATQGEGLVQVHVTRRQLGLAYPKRLKLRSLSDAVGLKLASRPESAGARGSFDAALREHGLDPAKLHRRALLCSSHRDIVLAVLSGKADVGVVSLAWAERAGLGCLPFAEEDYGICLRPSELARAPGRALVRALQGREIRKLLAASAGYDPRDAGALRL